MRNLLLTVTISTALLAGFGTGVRIANAQSGAAEDLPAYHANPPLLLLPATLDPKTFPDAENQKIYALAAKEKAVLYQQPCYCHCDKHAGHKSLLDCYVDRHASVCDVCKKEAVFAYQQSKRGKTPAQIRAAIIQGKWKEADLTQYATPGAVK
ncbi:MAG: CYCXC family (seleno)protein [Candidatus Acidiferrales bacterium]